MSSNKPLQPHHGEIPHHEDIPATATEAFLEKNFRKIVIGAVAVAAVASVGGLVRYKSHQTAVEAGEQLTAAKTVEDCDIVAQKFPGSNAAGNALLLKADLLWKANKKDSAVAALKEFTNAYSKHPFYQAGLIGLASKLEATGDKAGAKAIYDRFTGEFSKSEFAAVAQVRLADILWADGKEDEAKKMLELLPSKYPGEMTVEATQQRLDLIAAGLPTKEVDGPPQPKKEDKPAGTPTVGQPIEIKPGGSVTPIKLDAGLGTLSPTVPAPTAPSPAGDGKGKIEVKPAPASAVGQPKMLEPKPEPSKPTATPTAPNIKIGPPVKPATPPAGAPAVNPPPSPPPPANTPAAPAPAAAAPKPVTPPAPPADGDAKK